MKKFYYILILMCIVGVLPTHGTKRALVIGISEYRDSKWMNPRISAERDVVYVRKVLNTTGFSDSNINMLKNREATKANIVKAMEQLAGKCHTGDMVYIHFSGHGQLMTDTNGDEKPDILGEQWDEAWIPYDASFSYDRYDHGERHLCDDEIHQLLYKIRKKIGSKGEILVVVDACHSGDSTRDTDDDPSLLFPSINSGQAQFRVNSAQDKLCSGQDSEAPVTRGTRQNFIIPVAAAPSKSSRAKDDWITVSACKSYQLNSEMRDAQGLRIGMLTYGIYNLASKIGTVSNNEFETLLADFMKKNKHPKAMVGQSPQIDGTGKSRHIRTVFRK